MSTRQIRLVSIAFIIILLSSCTHVKNKDDTESIEITDKGKTDINGCNNTYAIIQGDWIYYTYDKDDGDEYHLYKTKNDSTKKVLVCKDDVRDLVVVGEWIYYISIDGIKRI